MTEIKFYILVLADVSINEKEKDWMSYYLYNWAGHTYKYVDKPFLLIYVRFKTNHSFLLYRKGRRTLSRRRRKINHDLRRRNF